MKKKVCFFLPFAVWMLFLVSCGTTYHFTIETQEPAKITFPRSVKNVLVVNNAVAQPSNVGFLLSINEKDVSNDAGFSLDTTTWLSAINLANKLRDAKYFNEVLLAKFPLRSDESWLEMKPVAQSVCDTLYEDSGTEAIITIDRLLFKTDQKLFKGLREYFLDPVYYFVNAKMYSRIYCSVYLAGKAKPLTSFSVQDSLFLNSTLEADSATVNKIITKEMFTNATLNISELLSTYFLPDWHVADRLIYYNQNSKMKEALSLFKNEKWEAAASIWTELFNSKEKTRDKARLACNIAVAKEMQDKLQDALLWAKKSKSTYLEDQTSQKDSTETSRIEQYVNALEKRAVDNSLLNIQMGNTK